MPSNSLWLFGLLSIAVCSSPFSATVYAESSRAERAQAALLQERQELARQEAQLAEDSIALEQRRATLAQRRAALLKREHELASDTSGQPSQRESGRDIDHSLANLGARDSDRGFVLTLSDIQFQRDESELTAETMRKLYPLATLLKDEPNRGITIEGYTDSTGDEEYNYQLSERRAMAVRDFLVSAGVNPQRITAQGYGEERPIASNDSERGRRENRRVEIVVARESGSRTAGR